MSKKVMGLLVMAYGTPYKEEDIERYYTHIRRGRKPSPEALEDLQNRYEAIGGISPLAKITQQQMESLEKRLNEVQDEIEFKAYLGLKHIEPFVEDAVEAMHKDGIKEAVSIVLAPHFSTFSVKSYNGRAKETAEKLGGPIIHSVESWYSEPKFIQYWATRVKQTFDLIDEEKRQKAVLIVSAHSLPEKIIAAGDPYPNQLQETADLIAQAAGIEHYEIGWQSAGNTPEPWIGPDVQDLTRELHEEKGYTSFVYTPVGFIADHLEVLYDNDYECKVVTDEIGADYYRPEMPNAQPEFIDGLATVVLKQIAR
ncbi:MULTISPECIES: ferrochelatase [Priestia]|jgi:ferrochelatase|uniref:Coproporphyrin III ferrochelatase n=4 Tax=Bacillaceae TaxID=186817 RepID=D5DZ13_PRIM1|nr:MULTISPECIES: ferrochelatase [Priestia]KOP72968.1 ferrochelatase [Bacillus sp. FJAT-21351]KQU17967.1 ferrochelatase [Bacillus sp. Leaf75]KRF49843.1 ferrochelatase [Bacillus sp. Soil531]MBZ5482210.1 ferrochelatase [Bacillus sp. T_4]MCJ7987624.1 ferrochelatase [Priestia sp. OVL9]MDH6656468.1 ferrochelatase [Bacillus sp. PvP124]MDP9579278.1 ferrochelatase [Bacillus sp. 1751]RFB21566.1 ferrochelatase [Bacillus sp. ALD]RFB33933.1 ferrochelatase [Bacillus sp. RC]